MFTQAFLSEYFGQFDYWEVPNVTVLGNEWLLLSEGNIFPDYFTSLSPGTNTTRNLRLLRAATEFTSSNKNNLKELLELRKISVESSFLLGCTYNYYHYVFDVLPRLKIYLELFPGMQYPMLTSSKSIRDASSFQYQWLRFLQLPESSLLGISSCENIESVPRLFCANVRKDLIFGDSHGSKYSQISWLRQTVRKRLNLECHHHRYNSKIFISRAPTSSARLKNQSEVEAFMHKSGYEVLYFERLPLKEQLFAVINAEKIAGLPGAGMANALFCSDTCNVHQIVENSRNPIYVSNKTLGWCKRKDLNRRMLLNDYAYYARYFKFMGIDYSVVQAKDFTG